MVAKQRKVTTIKVVAPNDNVCERCGDETFHEYLCPKCKRLLESNPKRFVHGKVELKTYHEVGRGLDNHGFYRIWLERSDDKIVGVSRRRFVELKNTGRIRPNFSSRTDEP